MPAALGLGHIYQANPSQLIHIIWQENFVKNSTVKTWAAEQSIFSLWEAKWTQPCIWSRIQSQVDIIHLVHSTGTIVSIPHLHSVKSYPEKSRPIKYGDWMHTLYIMIAIEYCYKLDRKILKLWCKLDRFLQTVTNIFSLLLLATHTCCSYVHMLYESDVISFKSCKQNK